MAPYNLKTQVLMTDAGPILAVVPSLAYRRRKVLKLGGRKKTSLKLSDIDQILQAI